MLTDLGGNQFMTVAVGAIGVLAGLLLAWIFRKLRRPKGRSGSHLDDLISRQDQFISLASHYMLTPISIIQTALSRLQEADASLSAEQRHKLYDAIDMGQRRLWIIAEQLVLVNDLDHSSLVLKFTPNDLSEMVSGAIADVDIFARNKKIHMVYKDMTQQFREARFDPRRMRQALIAILDNAIKFSNPGSEIEIRLKSVDSTYLLEVQDTGIGMPPETLKHITERFYRGSSLYNFNYEGFGLGLHIAYAIFDLHQGHVSVTSAPNQGTTFTVQFPIM